MEAGAVFQAASCTTMDSLLEAVAALYEVLAVILAAAPVIFSRGLGNVADLVVDISLEMDAVEVVLVAAGSEVVAVEMEGVALRPLAVSPMVDMELAAVDLAGMEVFGVVSLKHEVGAVLHVPSFWEMAAI